MVIGSTNALGSSRARRTVSARANIPSGYPAFVPISFTKTGERTIATAATPSIIIKDTDFSPPAPVTRLGGPTDPHKTRMTIRASGAFFHV